MTDRWLCRVLHADDLVLTTAVEGGAAVPSDHREKHWSRSGFNMLCTMIPNRRGGGNTWVPALTATATACLPACPRAPQKQFTDRHPCAHSKLRREGTPLPVLRSCIPTSWARPGLQTWPVHWVRSGPEASERDPQGPFPGGDSPRTTCQSPRVENQSSWGPQRPTPPTET